MTAHVREVDVDWQGVAEHLLRIASTHREVSAEEAVIPSIRIAARTLSSIFTGIGSAINNNLVKSPAIRVASDEDISGAVYAVLHDHVGTMTPDAMRDVADQVVEYVRRPE